MNERRSKGFFKMLTLTELNSQDFASFQNQLKNISLGHGLIKALWEHRPFHSIEHLLSELSKIIFALSYSGK